MGRKWWEGLIGGKKSETVAKPEERVWQSETSEGTAEQRIRQAAKTHAEALDLSNLGLAELPQSLGQVTTLRTLNLSGNRLSALPESLGHLSALQSLNLNDNQLTGLPESLGHLAALQTLELSDNRLTALPEPLGHLSADPGPQL